MTTAKKISLNTICTGIVAAFMVLGHAGPVIAFGGLTGALEDVTKKVQGDDASGDNSAAPVESVSHAEFAPSAEPTESATKEDGDTTVDPETGIATTVKTHSDGSRTVTKKDKDGRLISEEIFQAGKDKPEVVKTVDPVTGNTTTQVFDKDGTKSTIVTNSEGFLVSEKYTKPEAPQASLYDPDTGVTTSSVKNPDGSRTVTKKDKDSHVVSEERMPVAGSGEAFASAYDPKTGVTTTSRRASDGSRTVSTSKNWKDDKGAEHTQIKDNRGNQTEIVKLNDGSIVTTQWDKKNNMTQTTHSPDGSQKVVSPTRDGFVEEKVTGADGRTQVTKKDRAGNVLETTENTADGRKVTSDNIGVKTVTTPEIDGTYTVEKTDKKGNQVVTQYDSSGNIMNQSENLAVPKESGERYFENELGGKPGEWDTLPESTKHQYANSENQIKENAESELLRERQAQEKIQGDQETARWQAEQNRIMEDKLGKIAKEDEEAKARYAEFRKKEEFVAARADAEDKLKQYDRKIYEALSRGDKNEAERLLVESDALHDRSLPLFTMTDAEEKEVRRKQEVRDRLVQMVTSRGRRIADANLIAIEGEQELKETVTGTAQYLSEGARMQEITKETTRRADRELAFAQGKQEVIALMLSDPKTKAEERDMLHGMLDLADLQKYGSTQQLQSNAMLTAAGYGIDVAMTLTGSKLVGAAERGVEAAAGRLLATETAAKVVTATAETGVVTLAGQGATKAATAVTSRVAGDAAAQTVERALTADVGAAVGSKVSETATRVIGEKGVETVTNAATKAREVAIMDVRDAASRVIGRESKEAVATAASTEVATTVAQPKAPAAKPVENTAQAKPAENAAPAGKKPSEMTPAERQAHAIAKGDADINGVLRDSSRELNDGGTGILPAPAGVALQPAVGELSKGLTQAEVNALFKPGANLTAKQIGQKVDLLLTGYRPPVIGAPGLPPSGVVAGTADNSATVILSGQKAAAGTAAEAGTVITGAGVRGAANPGGTTTLPSGQSVAGVNPGGTTILNNPMGKQGAVRGGTQHTTDGTTAE